MLNKMQDLFNVLLIIQFLNVAHRDNIDSLTLTDLRERKKQSAVFSLSGFGKKKTKSLQQHVFHFVAFPQQL